MKITEWTKLVEGTWKSQNEQSWARGRENHRVNKNGWGDEKITEWTKLAEGTSRWKSRNEQSWLRRRENQRINKVSWGDANIKEWTKLVEGTWKSKNEQSWLRRRENQGTNKVGWGDVKIKERTDLFSRAVAAHWVQAMVSRGVQRCECFFDLGFDYWLSVRLRPFRSPTTPSDGHIHLTLPPGLLQDIDFVSLRLPSRHTVLSLRWGFCTLSDFTSHCWLCHWGEDSVHCPTSLHTADSVTEVRILYTVQLHFTLLTLSLRWGFCTLSNFTSHCWLCHWGEDSVHCPTSLHTLLTHWAEDYVH